ncbi:hypothetical protein T484DRAFT_3023954 [Baffinella frigidus]|nr:hypothetical protein T484DRAFT_3023954 [Cryptophyta sp. CCMP2293]
MEVSILRVGLNLQGLWILRVGLPTRTEGDGRRHTRGVQGSHLWMEVRILRVGLPTGDERGFAWPSRKGTDGARVGFSVEQTHFPHKALSGFRFRVSGCGFQVSGFRFRVSGGEGPYE